MLDGIGGAGVGSIARGANLQGWCGERARRVYGDVEGPTRSIARVMREERDDEEDGGGVEAPSSVAGVGDFSCWLLVSDRERISSRISSLVFSSRVIM